MQNLLANPTIGKLKVQQARDIDPSLDWNTTAQRASMENLLPSRVSEPMANKAPSQRQAITI
ncbi:hypothetical protein [Parachitinimonas caeni]|uniref:Uncharacterized protein n=1 Tax=Parachitinimonas caeni TaxID=3031301 RepID=A0ABT7DSV3_9NEIS|nr:hypothetical protein [Parachitinimonas caeni]MDK2123152.1 hypothetical protein [Parachitinimonas caeni]